MKDDHLGDVSELESRTTGALPPIDILRDVDIGKRANLCKIRAPHDKVACAGKAVLFNVQLETICKDDFVGFDCRYAASVVVPNTNVTPENSSIWR